MSAEEVSSVDAQVFLFLQGPLSSFFSDIADSLIRSGRTVIKVHFCGNDVMDWGHKGALHFRQSLSDWEAYLEETVRPHGVTHLVMHGDRRPYHQVASRWAKRHGIKVIATELGYLRPDWMTAERGACSTNSHFPTDPNAIRQIAADIPSFDGKRVYADSKLSLIMQELRFTFFNLMLYPLFPHYQSHRAIGPLKVYSGWILGQVRSQSGQATAKERFDQLLSSEYPYFVFALQLEGDLQLRDHSPFENVRASVRHVLSSFAKHAERDNRLVLKTHPHEFRLSALLADIERMADDLDLTERVIVIHGLTIGLLCQHATGFVTINSSAGFEAMEKECPTYTVMPTIYDCEGLTFNGTLDAFWIEKQRPDPTLFNALRTALAATIQVRGTLYNKAGRLAAAKAIAERLMDETINEPGAFVSIPPRLEKARRMGVSYAGGSEYEGLMS